MISDISDVSLSKPSCSDISVISLLVCTFILSESFSIPATTTCEDNNVTHFLFTKEQPFNCCLRIASADLKHIHHFEIILFTKSVQMSDFLLFHSYTGSAFPFTHLKLSLLWAIIDQCIVVLDFLLLLTTLAALLPPESIASADLKTLHIHHLKSSGLPLPVHIFFCMGDH